MKNLIKKYWPILFFAFIALLVLFTNYKKGTFLVGWDNTYPELNFYSNFKRIIFGVWQEYRGLGTLDGMAHTANISHWLVAKFLSFFLPINLIRYVFQVLAHFLGGVGAYLLFAEVFKNKNRLTFIDQFVGLMVGLFYQFNLMTIQMFFLPLEVFSFHFFMLPWGTLALWKFLKNPGLKSAILFLVVSLFGVSQAHVPSVFISYAIVQGMFLFTELLITKMRSWNTVLLAGLIIFVANAFWGLPYLYSAPQKALEISGSKINRFSTDEIFYRNLAWGDLKSVATFGGFNFDYLDWDGQKLSYSLMMGDWLKLYSSNSYAVISISISILALAGFFVAMWKIVFKKQLHFLPFALTGLLFFLFIANNTPMVGLFSKFARENVPYFHDIFRFTFTKFSLAYVFCVSIFLGIFISSIRESKILGKLKFIGFFVVILCFSYFFVVFKPVLRGWFFYPNLRQQIPQAYFETQKYFSNQPLGDRVVLLPLPNFYGWNDNKWGHRGSGFFWQMIAQPTTDRAFNAWSSQNESFFNQILYAVKNNDGELFKNSLQKHHANFVVIDSSLFSPGGDDQLNHLQRINDYLSDTSLFDLEAEYDFIKIYKVKLKDFNRPLFAPQSYSLVNENYIHHYASLDQAYGQLGDYILNDDGYEFPASYLQKESLETFPELAKNNLVFKIGHLQGKKIIFPSFAEKNISIVSNLEASIKDDKLKLKITPLLPKIIGDNISYPVQDFYVEKEIVLPQKQTDLLIIVEDQVFKYEELEASSSAKSLELPINRPITVFIASANPESRTDVTPLFANQKVADCWKNQQLDWFVKKSQGKIDLSSKNATACVSVPVSFEKNSKPVGGMIFAVEGISKSNTGVKPSVCLADANSYICGTNMPKLRINEENFGEFEIFSFVEPERKYVVNLLGKNEVENQQKEIIYDHISFSTYNVFEKIELDLSDAVLKYDESLQIIDGYEGKITIKVPQSLNNTNILNVQNSSFVSQSNCDKNFPNGLINREFKGDVVSYSATNKGSACDRFVLNRSLGQEILLNVKGQNLSGSGTKFSVYNSRTGEVALDITSGVGNFDNWYGARLLSESDLSEDFSLSLVTRSFGDEINSTKLTSLNIYQFPAMWLSSIRIDDSDCDNCKKDNNVLIESNKKFGTFLYLSKVKVVDDHGLLVLSQSFNGSWIAFDSSKPTEFFEHKISNGWANSWIIPNGEHEIVIIFWPQLLSFVGYSCLVIFALILSLITVRRQIRKNFSPPPPPNSFVRPALPINHQTNEKRESVGRE